MAATDLKNLRARLNIDTGAQLADELLDELLIHGLSLFNGETSQIFAATGTVLDREATAVEQRAIVLYSVLGYLNRQILPATENAVVISNVSGRTDLSNIEWALNKRRTETLAMIKTVMQRIISHGVNSEVNATELGQTLGVTPVICE